MTRTTRGAVGWVRSWPMPLGTVLVVVLLCLCALVRGDMVDLAAPGGLPLGCQMPSKALLGQCSSTQSGEEDSERIIVVGDIHGSYEGLLEDLFYANITSSRQQCKWKQQAVRTLLVQMGDLVDRGPGALDAIICLRELQKDAQAHNAQVYRLFGNHELWWLTGIFYERDPIMDTLENIKIFLGMLVQDILSGAVRGAHLHHFHSVPIVFVHAGYSPKFLKYLHKQQVTSVEAIVNNTARALVQAVQRCTQIPCQIRGEVFDAGPDRGGKAIGGPLWTDFGTLQHSAVAGHGHTDFLQVVGHTMAWCYSRRHPGVHPPDSQAECAQGLVRSTADLSSTCVDGGMYLGARAFLEITPDGHMVAHERRGAEYTVPWTRRDLTEDACGPTVRPKCA